MKSMCDSTIRFICTIRKKSSSPKEHGNSGERGKKRKKKNWVEINRWRQENQSKRFGDRTGRKNAGGRMDLKILWFVRSPPDFFARINSNKESDQFCFSFAQKKPIKDSHKRLKPINKRAIENRIAYLYLVQQSVRSVRKAILFLRILPKVFFLFTWIKLSARIPEELSECSPKSFYFSHSQSYSNCPIPVNQSIEPCTSFNGGFDERSRNAMLLRW